MEKIADFFNKMGLRCVQEGSLVLAISRIKK
jgi:hypothetical protein